MKIAIIGFGIEGRALMQYFAKQGHEITICDINRKIEKEKSGSKIHYRFGPHYLSNLQEFDVIFRSPGIPYLKHEFNPVRDRVTSLARYFFEYCPCPIIGVTGTKGKGTTATLIYEMLKPAGKKTYLGGNIGKPPLEFLDELKKDDLVILELSSFQLQDLDRSPHIAVVLGITPDHFDHHENMEEYIEAKRNIVRFQKKGDIAILDIDNPRSAGFARSTKAKILQVSTEKSVAEGAFLKVGSLIIKRGKTGIIVGEKGQTGLIGNHNLKNILAAAAAADQLGVPVEVISKVIREWRGLPHRLEFVGEKGGIRFYNDSASTNPETAIAALRTFSNPTILIAGGSDKGIDFTPLGEEIAKRLNVKTVILMGETKRKIERAIEQAVGREEKRIAEMAGKVRRRDIPLELISAETYHEAFMVAKLIAQPGDTALLSPACASFDMFSNYQERGEIFRNFVIASASEAI